MMSEHLKELKLRVMICLIFFSVIFTITFIFSDKVYEMLSIPLLKQLPQGSGIIATHITAPFFIPFKLCVFVTTLLSIPFFLYHVWSFILPGLYENEKKIISPIITLSILLFYIGILFAFFVICPITINFFSNCAPKGVIVMTDIAHYLNFMTTTLVITGLTFQIPVITNVIIKLNVITKENFQKKRPTVILLSFIFGMLLTPPDVLSQILLAIPMWFLFEIGLIFS